MNKHKKEAADIYVYRLAELKAVQIGLVSRALKEISIDCLLNIDQTGFTVKEMNTVVSQRLSNKQEIQYQVGDRPYTSTCDYMKKCIYKCKPIKKIKEIDVSLNTYNETFIMMNIDKIIQRIMDIFRDRFYYKKARLIKEINVVKKYPLLQINAALNQMTEDKNEYLVDMYGRMGRLVNIDDLYLFQPIELTDKNISIYERSVPVEYKRDNIIFPIAEEITEALVHVVKHKKGTKEGEEVFKLINDLYTQASSPQKITTGKNDWYEYCSQTIAHMETEGWDRPLINKLLIHHIIESLSFDENIIILNYLEAVDTEDRIASDIRAYYANITVASHGLVAIILQNSGKLEPIIKSEQGSWVKAQPQDNIDLKDELLKLIHGIMPIAKHINEYVGFMVNFKKEYMVFKVREIAQTRNTGARCDQASKSKTIQILNIIGEDQYTNKSPMGRQELCIIMEFVLRKNNMEKLNNKRWFLRPVEAVLINDTKKAY